MFCAGGEDNSAAVLNDGSMYMWGSAARGKLGCGRGGEATCVNIPHLVTFERQKKSCVATCSLGPEHTGCVTTEGKVYMWGSGYYGKLGLGHTTNVYSPALVASLSGHPCQQITCGSQHTLAVTIAGDLFAWGVNDERLGLYEVGGSTNLKKKQKKRLAPVWTPMMVKKYRQLSITVSSASAGEYCSVVVDDDGNVWSFGKGGGALHSYGTLGTSNALTALSDDPSLLSTTEPKQVTALYDQAKRSGSGGPGGLGGLEGGPKGMYLQLGDNSGVGATTSKSDFLLPSHQAPMACTRSHHCVALTTAGEVYTWGCGGFGRLGHGAESRALYRDAVNKATAYNLRLSEEGDSDDDDNKMPSPLKPVLNPMESTARMILNPYLTNRELLKESKKLRAAAGAMVEMETQLSHKKGKRGRDSCWAFGCQCFQR